VLALAELGKVRCRITTRPLPEVNRALEDLGRGQVIGRVVLAVPQPAA